MSRKSVNTFELARWALYSSEKQKPNIDLVDLQKIKSWYLFNNFVSENNLEKDLKFFLTEYISEKKIFMRENALWYLDDRINKLNQLIQEVEKLQDFTKLSCFSNLVSFDSLLFYLKKVFDKYEEIVNLSDQQFFEKIGKEEVVALCEEVDRKFSWVMKKLWII